MNINQINLISPAFASSSRGNEVKRNTFRQITTSPVINIEEEHTIHLNGSNPDEAIYHPSLIFINSNSSLNAKVALLLEQIVAAEGQSAKMAYELQFLFNSLLDKLNVSIASLTELVKSRNESAVIKYAAQKAELERASALAKLGIILLGITLTVVTGGVGFSSVGGIIGALTILDASFQGVGEIGTVIDPESADEDNSFDKMLSTAGLFGGIERLLNELGVATDPRLARTLHEIFGYAIMMTDVAEVGYAIKNGTGKVVAQAGEHAGLNAAQNGENAVAHESIPKVIQTFVKEHKELAFKLVDTLVKLIGIIIALSTSNSKDKNSKELAGYAMAMAQGTGALLAYTGMHETKLDTEMAGQISEIILMAGAGIGTGYGINIAFQKKYAKSLKNLFDSPSWKTMQRTFRISSAKTTLIQGVNALENGFKKKDIAEKKLQDELILKFRDIVRDLLNKFVQNTNSLREKEVEAILDSIKSIIKDVEQLSNSLFNERA